MFLDRKCHFTPTVCDKLQMLESLGLGNAELPLLVIVDALSGQMTICDQPDVDQNVVEQFIADFKVTICSISIP